MQVSIEFKDLVHTKTIEIDGHSAWVWPNADTASCWGAITETWIGSQRNAYLRNTANRPRKVCVQAGGNCGLFPRLLSNYFERVYTFEPDYLNFFCLTLNCQKSNIYKMQAALGAKHDLCDLNRSWSTNVGGFNIELNSSNRTIPVVTIDSLNLDACDFIQLDVEGHDYLALVGGLETIKKYKPVISAERAGADILTMLGELGYVVSEVAGDDSIFIQK
jgi:FkbM family methyltransferase